MADAKRHARGSGVLVKLLWIALVMAPARRVLIGVPRLAGLDTSPRFETDDVERVLRSGWRHFEALAPGLPSQPNLSGKVSVLGAAMLLALVQSLIEAGVEREYANRLVAEVGWAAYLRSMGRLGPWLLRKLSANPRERLRLAMEIGLGYEFTEPAYHHRRVAVAGGDGFDMLRCPIADYLAAQHASDLCTTAFCALDYRIFELVGMRLERSGTIGGGADLCDFRAFPESPGRSDA
jgi:ubiquinone biosynthesis protein